MKSFYIIKGNHVSQNEVQYFLDYVEEVYDEDSYFSDTNYSINYHKVEEHYIPEKFESADECFLLVNENDVDETQGTITLSKGVVTQLEYLKIHKSVGVVWAYYIHNDNLYYVGLSLCLLEHEPNYNRGNWMRYYTNFYGTSGLGYKTLYNQIAVASSKNTESHTTIIPVDPDVYKKTGREEQITLLLLRR